MLSVRKRTVAGCKRHNSGTYRDQRIEALVTLKQQAEDVQDMLEAMVTSLPDLDPESLKNFLRGLIDRVVWMHPA